MSAIKTSYGIEIKMTDKMDLEEFKKQSVEVEKIMSEYKSKNIKFSLLLDLTEVKLQKREVMAEMMASMKSSKEIGIQRVSIIFSNPIAKLQISQKAKEAGTDNIEKYFSIEDTDYKNKALDWVIKGV
ncbi:MAG: hypothetical protein ACK4IX_04860 [Candidatus Sericytochromatia bacterium]